MSADAPGQNPVNEHYLDRIVAVGDAEVATVEATEDIVSGNGTKLLAKGARIDARARDRLLQHKLRKPLEQCVRVIDGVASRPIDGVARALLERHALLEGLCRGRIAQQVLQALHQLQLSTELESMLSLYAAQGPHKLEHAVGVGLIGAATMAELTGQADGLQSLLRAGLMHDIGELYIAPALLAPGARLTPAQWKHIATHPIVAGRLLREMPGAGAAVAEAVLHHHERLDGFGYPQGVRGPQLPLAGQVLAVAEMLMGLIESGRSPGERAAVAVKLIPGEYGRPLLDRVAAAVQASAAADGAEHALAPADPAGLSQRAQALGCALNALGEVAAALGGQGDALSRRLAEGSPGLQDLVGHMVERYRRIRFSFSSTGLDSRTGEALLPLLATLEPAVHCEIGLVLREIGWRLRELQREALLRAERLPPGEAAMVRDLVERGQRAAERGAQVVA